LRSVSVLLALACALGGLAVAEGDGSRTRPVHIIPLYDENGEKISPLDKDGMPFSVRTTCGECHDYETIALGHHFNSHDPHAVAGRPAQPWVLADKKTGTQLPISSRGWKGVWHPQDLGMSPWEFTKIFGRNLPGGDWAEVEEDAPDPESRWNVSGRLEINCLGCHNASPAENHSEWVIQTARENFRWAATASAGLGLVGGVASRVEETWDPIDGPDLDNAWATPPSVDYTESLFDAKDRVCLDVRSDIPANRCYACHSNAIMGEALEHIDEDVHVAAGLTCTDCHRNGLDHRIVRGSETSSGDPEVTTLSCRGCHYGEVSATGGTARGGRLGAPRPEHKGVPETHLDSLTCTACHSGPWPEAKPHMVRTARANRLGVHGKADWYTELPYISTPVFMPNAQDELGPHNMLWPAYWANVEGDAVKPLMPKDVARVAGEILAPQAQVARVLAALTPRDVPGAVAAYAYGGRVYEMLTAEVLKSEVLESSGNGVWGIMQKGEWKPLVLDSLGWTLDGILKPAAPLAEVQIAKVLEQIDYDSLSEGDPVYLNGGKAYRWTNDGAMVVEDAPAGQAEAANVWADLVEGEVKPIDAEVMSGEVQSVIDFEQPASQEAIAKVLAALDPLCGGEAVAAYWSGGKLYRVAGEGAIEEVPAPSAKPETEVAWLVLDGEAVRPLVPEYVSEAIGATSLTEAQVKLVLAALGSSDLVTGEAAYIAGGCLYRLQGDDLAADATHDAAKPYAWPIAHDVRPAAQALGAQGRCDDCHADGAPFFYAEVEPQSPAALSAGRTVAMWDFEGYDSGLLKGWERSVQLRPITVYGGLVAAGLVAIALIRYGFMALESILRALVIKGGKAQA